jgi:denticleless
VKLWDPRFQQKTQPQAVASLPDPTAVNGARPRGIHAMCEQPSTGDLHILTGDSKIHVVRPSLNVAGDNSDLIQPVRYVHPELRSNFWMGISFSPCGRYLASGSTKGGVMAWDTASRPRSVRGSVNEVVATRLSLGESCDGREREVNAVDWGYDMVSSFNSLQ